METTIEETDNKKAFLNARNKAFIIVTIGLIPLTLYTSFFSDFNVFTLLFSLPYLILALINLKSDNIWFFWIGIAFMVWIDVSIYTSTFLIPTSGFSGLNMAIQPILMVASLLLTYTLGSIIKIISNKRNDLGNIIGVVTIIIIAILFTFDISSQILANKQTYILDEDLNVYESYKQENTDDNKVTQTDANFETIDLSDAEEEKFTDLYSIEFPEGWSYNWNDYGYNAAPSPLKNTKTYTDENGYYKSGRVAAPILHFYPSVIFDESIYLKRFGPEIYSYLISVAYETDLKESAITELQKYHSFNVRPFTSNNGRFKGISKIDTFAQDYGLFPKYEINLIDTIYGDVITLSVSLEGEEVDELRSMIKPSYYDSNSEPVNDFEGYDRAINNLKKLIENTDREKLSFGYLMNDLDNIANSITGINKRM